MSVRRFTTIAEPRERGGIAIRLPFDPSVAWGEKDRHHVTGTINRWTMRGSLTRVRDDYYLLLGPSWCRDPSVGPGAQVSVFMQPEGPQIGSMSPDIAAALHAEPAARRHFESLATFYRKGYVRWIEGAKRPETRADRIRQSVVALKAGRKSHDAT